MKSLGSEIHLKALPKSPLALFIVLIHRLGRAVESCTGGKLYFHPRKLRRLSCVARDGRGGRLGDGQWSRARRTNRADVAGGAGGADWTGGADVRWAVGRAGLTGDVAPLPLSGLKGDG